MCVCVFFHICACILILCLQGRVHVSKVNYYSLIAVCVCLHGAHVCVHVSLRMCVCVCVCVCVAKLIDCFAEL